MSYQPQPGTIPHKVVEYLKVRPRQRVAQAVILEAIGQPGIQLSAYLQAAIKAGSVVHHQGATFELGDGAALPDHDFDPEDIPNQRVVPAPNGTEPLDMAFWASGGLIFRRGKVEFPISAHEASAALDFMERVAKGVVG